MAPVPEPVTGSPRRKDQTGRPLVKEQRKAAWLRTRQIGFASFVIPSGVIMYMLYHAEPKVRDSLWSITLDSNGAVALTILYFVVWTNIEVFLNVFKYYLCKQWYGMS